MIKHSFKKAEIFHEWIYCSHNEPIYYNGKDYGKSITGIGNYLFAGDKKHLSVESIKENFPRVCVAIINRTKKEVVIDKSYICSNDLLMDIPKDYDIFITYKKLEYGSLEDTESKLKNHLAYLIENLYNFGLRCEFIALNSKALYHGIAENVYKENNKHGHKTYYGTIVNFINKYKIKKYKFYKENIVKEVDIPRYNGWTKLDSITISCKTPKEIYEKKIFTKKELDTLEKRNFYTKYCYGEGISLSDVYKYWDSKFDKEVHTKGHFAFTNSTYNDLHTWRDYIKARKKASEIWKSNYDKSIREESRRNRDYAIIAFLNKNNYKSLGDHFRKTGSISISIEFKGIKYIKNRLSLDTVRDYISFVDRVQLKLSKDNKYVETSRNCVVSLEDAIRLFRIFKLVVERNSNVEEFDIDYHSKQIMCGRYQLLKIYKSKKIDIIVNPDEETPQNIIVIGCHYIWYQDVIEFIKYYKLEKDFGIL